MLGGKRCVAAHTVVIGRGQGINQTNLLGSIEIQILSIAGHCDAVDSGLFQVDINSGF